MKRQDKFARFIVMFLFAITVMGAGFFYMLPLRHAQVPTDKMSVLKESESGLHKITLSGEINNCTPFEVEKITIKVTLRNQYNSYISTQTFIIDEDFDAKEKDTFSETFTVFTNETIKEVRIDKITCSYDKFPWYVILIVGLVVITLVKFLFIKRKYYFEIEDKNVVIYASWRQAGVIVDGVLIKEGKLPLVRAEVSLFNMKIAGHRLRFYTLNADVIPNIRALVDNVPVHYTRVRQNLGVKMMDEGTVRGEGNITMRSQYEIEGEAADKYNEEQRKEREQQAMAQAAPQVKYCKYCGVANDANSKVCSSCGARLN